MNGAHDAPILAALTSMQPPSGQVVLHWLGQSGFLVRGAGTTLLVDPFLSPHPDRLVPAPFAPGEAAGVEVVACTHDHLDHLDDGFLAALAEASPATRFVVPAPVAERVAGLGIPPERVVGAQPDAPIALGSVTVHPVPACHGVEPGDAYSFGRELSGGLYRYLGYVFELGGVRVYHAGDTIPYEGMAERLRGLRVDVALLPINGRDAAREAQGIVGNLDELEAAELAARIEADLLVPTHYDMFAANPGSPARLVEEAARRQPELAVLVPSRARPFTYTRPEGKA